MSNSEKGKNINRIKGFNISNAEKADIYNEMWGSLNENKEIGLDFFSEVVPNSKTLNGRVYSYCFNVLSNVAEYLVKQFDIKDEHQKAFFRAFRDVCSGSGSELGKISKLHSSSLCALLHFFLLSDENKNNTYDIVLSIDGDKYTFTEAFFEFQNRVIKSPSNVDVVLLGENDSTKEKAVLFLESKFSEYIISVVKQEKLSSAYLKDRYGESILSDKEFKNMYTYDGKILKENDNNYCYLEGIKQTISHYIGIRNRLDDIDKRKPIKTEKEKK